MTTDAAAALKDRGCTGKHAYDSPRVARLVANRLNAEPAGGLVSPYRCPWCGSWHVGHPPSVEGMRHVLAAIRDVDPNPQPHDPPPSGRRRRRRKPSTSPTEDQR